MSGWEKFSRWSRRASRYLKNLKILGRLIVCRKSYFKAMVREFEPGSHGANREKLAASE